MTKTGGGPERIPNASRPESERTLAERAGTRHEIKGDQRESFAPLGPQKVSIIGPASAVRLPQTGSSRIVLTACRSHPVRSTGRAIYSLFSGQPSKVCELSSIVVARGEVDFFWEDGGGGAAAPGGSQAARWGRRGRRPAPVEDRPVRPVRLWRAARPGRF